MKSLIRICRFCGTYTMKEICPNCMRDTVVALPPKFSPSDKFQRFRLKEGSEKWRR